MNTNGIFVADQNFFARSTLFLQPQARTCDARWTASFLTLLPCFNPCSLHICQTLSPSAQLVREMYMAFEKSQRLWHAEPCNYKTIWRFLRRTWGLSHTVLLCRWLPSNSFGNSLPVQTPWQACRIYLEGRLGERGGNLQNFASLLMPWLVFAKHCGILHVSPMNILHLFSHNEARPHDREQNSPVQFNTCLLSSLLWKGKCSLGLKRPGSNLVCRLTWEVSLTSCSWPYNQI